MKRLKFLSIFAITFCLSIILCGNVKGINLEFVAEGQPLVNYDYKELVPITKNHTITLESSSNASDRFRFYSRTENPSLPKKTINNNYPDGYNYYILPYGAESTSDNGRDSYSTRFNGNESFTVRYHGIATYNGRNVDCLVTIEPRSAGADNYIDDWITDYEGINFTNYGAIGFHDNFYQGFTYFNTGGATITYNLVYEGTSTNIGIKEMYWSWGSVNKPEGIASMENVNTYYLVNSTSYAHTTFTNFNDGVGGIEMANKAYAKNYSDLPKTLVWGVGLDAQSCSDTWAVEDFDRTFVGFKVQSSNGIYRFRTLSHDFWFCPFFYPMGATADPPYKKVKTTTSAWADQVEVFVGDTINYSVNQKVENRQQGGTGYMKYTSMKLVDHLPKEVEYKSAYIVASDGSTPEGTLTYDAATHTVTYEFSSSFLKNKMAYIGETYSLIIECVVDDDSIEGQAFDNTPISIINDTTQTNTPVKVIPHYKNIQFTISKEDAETGKTVQGDAKFAGAEYGIYLDSNCTNLLEKVILDDNGNTTSAKHKVVGYRNGVRTVRENFYIKETKAPEGYLIDNTIYPISVNEKTDFPDTNTILRSVSLTSKETVIKNDIEIIKYLEETDSTEKQILSGATFTATLISSIGTDNVKSYTATTDENGYCKFVDLPYGKYRIQETTIPDVAYNGEFYLGDETTRRTSFDVYVEQDKTVREAYKYELTDVAKKMQIKIYKEDIETGTTTQGDATLAGAKYSLYRDKECTDLIETVTIVKNDSDNTWIATSGWYLVGTYYVKETQTPEGYLIDNEVYEISQEPKLQTVEKTLHPITSKELVMKGDIYVVKFLNEKDTTDENPAVGCKLYLTLDSSVASANPKVYEATVDEDGYCKWTDIPYGWYTITESEEAREAGFKLMDPEPLYISYDKERLYRIIGENEIETYVKVEKKDKESNQIIPVAGVRYKIWSYKDNAYIEQVTEEGRVTEFQTNNYGYLYTPQKLKVGKYKLVELDPPYGYRNEDMDFEIKDGVFENTEEVPIVTVSQLDEAQKGKIQVTKTAEVLVGTKQTTDTETGLEVLTPVYETRGLQGVTYRVTAMDDIKSGDGQLKMSKGSYVTITTDAQGIASTDDLYLGTYTLQEVDTITGYILSDKIETITLDYRTEGRDSEGRLIVSENYTVSKEYENERVPYSLEFEKTYGITQYNNVDEEVKNKVKFGLYAAEDIVAYQSNNVLIRANSLLEVISVKDGKASATVDLPVGEYYIKEIDTDIPYEIDNTKYSFSFKPSKTSNLQKIEINNNEPINNEPKQAELNLLKLSRKIYNTNTDVISSFIENKDLEGFKAFARENGLSGAKYQVYFKNNSGEYQKLQVLNQENSTWEDVIFETGDNGIDSINLPYGTYYVKEIEAPKDHEIDPNYNEVKVSDEINISVVEDTKIKGKITVIHKDVDTDEEIYDREKYEDDIDEPYTTVDREEEINDTLDLDFDAYELVEEKYPENAEGYYEKEEQVIIYYYKKVMSDVIVKYVDVDTLEEISSRFKYIDYIGKDYDTFAKEIPGYELVVEMLPGNANGQYERDTIEVIYYYRKLPVDTSDINFVAIFGIVAISLLGIVTISRKKNLN